MIAERELTEYKALCAVLLGLREKFHERKQALKKLLEETAGRRKAALELLAKANRLTGNLTGRQRQMTGLSYYPGEIKAKLKLAGSFQDAQNSIALSEGKNEIQPSVPDGCQTSLELKRSGLAVVLLIDQVKKSLLELNVLEMRCLELTASLDKAMEAFSRESRRIRKSVYPLGFISIFYRLLRRLAGRTYFCFRDLNSIADLGNITVLVLKIADSPVI
jgi:hypothetical protein